MGKYRHLTYTDRVKLEALYRAGHTQVFIAKELKCNRGTVARELRRGCYQHECGWYSEKRYSAERAQQVHDFHATAKGAPLKIGNDYEFVKHVEKLILIDVEKLILIDKRSPDVIIGRLERDGYVTDDGKIIKCRICTKTLYNYIERGDIFPNVTVKNLEMQGKRIMKKPKYKAPVKQKKPNNRSITERPAEIQERQEVGHWEMDTVIGKQGKGPVLLVLTERKTRAEIIRKIDGKTQTAVQAELDKLEIKYGSDFGRIFKTITIDNGSEFLNQELLEKSVYGGIRTTAYYCHTYAASERGSNENANKLIRRFIPKGADIDQYNEEYIQYVENWINTLPRRILEYATAQELLQYELSKAAA